MRLTKYRWYANGELNEEAIWGSLWKLSNGPLYETNGKQRLVNIYAEEYRAATLLLIMPEINIILLFIHCAYQVSVRGNCIQAAVPATAIRADDPDRRGNSLALKSMYDIKLI